MKKELLMLMMIYNYRAITAFICPSLQRGLLVRNEAHLPRCSWSSIRGYLQTDKYLVGVDRYVESIKLTSWPSKPLEEKLGVVVCAKAV
jgi:hypothetical protein